ncbi:MAG: alpha/beta hydrolase [Bacteroidales bacterium]|nr:alpha/beta hydrolase [Bacteroidales bacterium]
MPAELPYTTPKYEVSVEQNVVYTRAMGYRKDAPEDSKNALPVSFGQGKMMLLDLDMDIYTPVGDPSSKRPLLLMMHGGSFFIGNKEEKGQVAWCRYFASLGYVAACINYRMGFNLGKKSYCKAEDRAVEDAVAALNYLLERDDLHIDAEHIFAAGTSAGAIVALRLAFCPKVGNRRTCAAGGDAGSDADRKHPRICAVGNFWGSVRDLSILENASTPILSFQATGDPIMPYGGGYPFKKFNWGPTRIFAPYMYGTKAIHDRALELGIRAEHHPYPLAKHRLHMDREGNFTPFFYEIRDRMATFFAEELV